MITTRTYVTLLLTIEGTIDSDGNSYDAMITDIQAAQGPIHRTVPLPITENTISTLDLNAAFADQLDQALRDAL